MSYLTTVDDSRKRECIWSDICSETDCAECLHFCPYDDYSGEAAVNFEDKAFDEYWKDWLSVWNDYLERVNR